MTTDSSYSLQILTSANSASTSSIGLIWYLNPTSVIRLQKRRPLSTVEVMPLNATQSCHPFKGYRARPAPSYQGMCLESC